MLHARQCYIGSGDHSGPHEENVSTFLTKLHLESYEEVLSPTQGLLENWIGCHRPVNLALKGSMPEEGEFKTTLSYTVRLCRHKTEERRSAGDS